MPEPDDTLLITGGEPIFFRSSRKSFLWTKRTASERLVRHKLDTSRSILPWIRGFERGSRHTIGIGLVRSKSNEIGGSRRHNERYRTVGQLPKKYRIGVTAERSPQQSISQLLPCCFSVSEGTKNRRALTFTHNLIAWHGLQQQKATISQQPDQRPHGPLWIEVHENQ